MHPLIARYKCNLEQVLSRLLTAEEVYQTLMAFFTQNSSSCHNETPVDQPLGPPATCSPENGKFDEEKFVLQSDLDAIKHLVLSHDQFVQEMVEFGHDVEKVLAEGEALIESKYPSAEEKSDLVQQRSLLRQKYSSLYQSACQKQARLNDALILREKKQIDKLKEWLTYAEDKISQLQEVASDRESLNRQVKEHENFQQQMAQEQESLDTLTTLTVVMEEMSTHELREVKDCSHFAVGTGDLLNHSDLEDQLHALSEKWSTVCRFVKERGCILLFITCKLQMLQEEEGRFNQWICSLDRQLQAMEKAVAQSEKIGSTFVSELMKRLQRLEHEMESEHIHYSSAVEEGQRLLDRLEKNSPIWHEINNKLRRLTDIWDVRVQQIENLALALAHLHRRHMQRQKQIVNNPRLPANEEDEQNAVQHGNPNQSNEFIESCKFTKTQPPRCERENSGKAKQWQRKMQDISTFLGRMEDDLGLDDEGNGAVVWEQLAIEEQQILLEDTEAAIEDRQDEIDELIAQGKQIIDEMKCNGNQVKQLLDINQAVEERWHMVKEEVQRKRIFVGTVTALPKFNCKEEATKGAISSHQETQEPPKMQEDQTLKNSLTQLEGPKVKSTQVICKEEPEMSQSESIKNIKFFINFWESVNGSKLQREEKIHCKTDELKTEQQVADRESADEGTSFTDGTCTSVHEESCENEEENTNDAKAALQTHNSNAEDDHMPSHPLEIVLPSRQSGVFEVHQVVHKPLLEEEDESTYTESDDEAECESPSSCVEGEREHCNEFEGQYLLAKNTDGSTHQPSCEVNCFGNFDSAGGREEGKKEVDEASSQTAKSPKAIVNLKCEDIENEEKENGVCVKGEILRKKLVVNTSSRSLRDEGKCSLPTSEKVIYDVPQTFCRKVNIDCEKSMESHDRTTEAKTETGPVGIQSNFISSIESNELRSTLQQPFGDAKSNSEGSSSSSSSFSFSLFSAFDHSTPLDGKEASEMDLSHCKKKKRVATSHEQISCPSTSNEEPLYEKSVEASQNALLYANNAMSGGESECKYRANVSPSLTASEEEKDSFFHKQKQGQLFPPPPSSSSSSHPEEPENSSVMYHLDSCSSSRSFPSHSLQSEQNEMEKHLQPSVIVLGKSGNNVCQNLIIKSSTGKGTCFNSPPTDSLPGDSTILTCKSATSNCHASMHMTLKTLEEEKVSTSPHPSPIAACSNDFKKIGQTSGKDRMDKTAMKQHTLLATATDAPFERSIICSNNVPYYIDHAKERTQWDHPVMSHLMDSLLQLNEIRFSAYRTGLKLLQVRKHLCLHLVPLALLAETFDRYGLGGQNDRLLSVPEMVTCLQCIFETAIGKEETISDEKTLVKVPLVIDLTLNWLLNLFDT